MPMDDISSSGVLMAGILSVVIVGVNMSRSWYLICLATAI